MSLSTGFSRLQLAMMTLVDSGSTPDEAKDALLADPSMVERLADAIDAKAAEIDAEGDRQKAQEAAASPEGRRRAGAAALRAEQERAEAVEGAKAMLRAEGINPEGMEERELLVSVGMEKKSRGEMSWGEWDREVERFASLAPKMSEEERIAEARRLDVDLSTVDSYNETVGGGETS